MGKIVSFTTAADRARTALRAYLKEQLHVSDPAGRGIYHVDPQLQDLPRSVRLGPLMTVGRLHDELMMRQYQLLNPPAHRGST